MPDHTPKILRAAQDAKVLLRREMPASGSWSESQLVEALGRVLKTYDYKDRGAGGTASTLRNLLEFSGVITVHRQGVESIVSVRLVSTPMVAPPRSVPVVPCPEPNLSTFSSADLAEELHHRLQAVKARLMAQTNGQPARPSTYTGATPVPNPK